MKITTDEFNFPSQQELKYFEKKRSATQLRQSLLKLKNQKQKSFRKISYHKNAWKVMINGKMTPRFSVYFQCCTVQGQRPILHFFKYNQFYVLNKQMSFLKHCHRCRISNKLNLNQQQQKTQNISRLFQINKNQRVHKQTTYRKRKQLMNQESLSQSEKQQQSEQQLFFNSQEYQSEVSESQQSNEQSDQNSSMEKISQRKKLIDSNDKFQFENQNQNNRKHQIQRKKSSKFLQGPIFKFPPEKQLQKLKKFLNRRSIVATINSMSIRYRRNAKYRGFDKQETLKQTGEKIYVRIFKFHCCQHRGNFPFMQYTSKDKRNYTLQSYSLEHYRQSYHPLNQQIFQEKQKYNIQQNYPIPNNHKKIQKRTEKSEHINEKQFENGQIKMNKETSMKNLSDQSNRLQNNNQIRIKQISKQNQLQDFRLSLDQRHKRFLRRNRSKEYSNRLIKEVKIFKDARKTPGLIGQQKQQGEYSQSVEYFRFIDQQVPQLLSKNDIMIMNNSHWKNKDKTSNKQTLAKHQQSDLSEIKIISPVYNKTKTTFNRAQTKNLAEKEYLIKAQKKLITKKSEIQYYVFKWFQKFNQFLLQGLLIDEIESIDISKIRQMSSFSNHITISNNIQEAKVWEQRTMKFVSLLDFQIIPIKQLQGLPWKISTFQNKLFWNNQQPALHPKLSTIVYLSLFGLHIDSKPSTILIGYRLDAEFQPHLLFITLFSITPQSQDFHLETLLQQNQMFLDQKISSAIKAACERFQKNNIVVMYSSFDKQMIEAINILKNDKRINQQKMTISFFPEKFFRYKSLYKKINSYKHMVSFRVSSSIKDFENQEYRVSVLKPFRLSVQVRADIFEQLEKNQIPDRSSSSRGSFFPSSYSTRNDTICLQNQLDKKQFYLSIIISFHMNLQCLKGLFQQYISQKDKLFAQQIFKKAMLNSRHQRTRLSFKYLKQILGYFKTEKKSIEEKNISEQKKNAYINPRQLLSHYVELSELFSTYPTVQDKFIGLSFVLSSMDSDIQANKDRNPLHRIRTIFRLHEKSFESFQQLFMFTQVLFSDYSKSSRILTFSKEIQLLSFRQILEQFSENFQTKQVETLMSKFEQTFDSEITEIAKTCDRVVLNTMYRMIGQTLYLSIKDTETSQPVQTLQGHVMKMIVIFDEKTQQNFCVIAYNIDRMQNQGEESNGKKWFCQCRFYDFTGLPCQHEIMCALNHKHVLINEISSCWKSNSKDQK